jgi:hypothetical protein
MCRTMQRAVIHQARREGLPVWAWLLVRGSPYQIRPHPTKADHNQSRRANRAHDDAIGVP